MPELLVSVCSVAEALAAVRGGADVIDIKDPATGPLGKADDQRIDDIIHAVADQRRLSVALDELVMQNELCGATSPDFVKWGLAGCGRTLEWQGLFASMTERLRKRFHKCVSVPVAYADHREATAPAVEAVVDWCVKDRRPILLIDTYTKTGRTLLDHLPIEQLASLTERCAAGGVRLALAGSLGEREIHLIRKLAVDWVGVRKSACDSHDRMGVIDRARVARLVTALRAAPVARL